MAEVRNKLLERSVLVEGGESRASGLRWVRVCSNCCPAGFSARAAEGGRCVRVAAAHETLPDRRPRAICWPLL